MTRQLLPACILATCIACGVEEPESGTHFIGKTQANTTSYPTSDGAHRPGGVHENAYLINKVHKEDHGSPADPRSDPYSLTVAVNVGWWKRAPKACGVNLCTTPVQGGGTPPSPGTCNDSSDATKTHPCTVRYCLPPSTARAEVNAAIDKWLDPLRTQYRSRYGGIVKKEDYRQGGKTPPDLTVNFMCNASFHLLTCTAGSAACATIKDLLAEINAHSGYCAAGSTCTAANWKWPGYTPTATGEEATANGCVQGKGTSCTLYTVSNRVHSSKPARLKSVNQPAIYLGNAIIPRASRGYDAIGYHDRLDLLHEIGHALGLADTHTATDKSKRANKQPRSIMSRDRIGKRGNNSLLLGRDDIIGIQWLYEHHRNGVATTDCRFPDEYRHENYPGTPQGGCVPLYPLISALKRERPSEAITIIGRDDVRGQPVGTDPFLDINAREPSTGYSALHYAIYLYSKRTQNTPTENADYLLVIDKLIAYTGINLNIIDNERRTPLHFAAQYELQNIIIKLLAGKSIQLLVQDKNGDTPLHTAAKLGWAHIVSTMNSSYGNLAGIKNNQGRTAMHLAAHEGHTQVVRAFGNYSGGIAGLAAAEDNDGNTALHLATDAGRSDVVTVLLQNDKTLLNDQNNKDETPLHLAAKFGRATTVERLLQQTGIEVNRQDDQGNTPLHLAAKAGHASIVTLLLNKAGIDTTILNSSNKTARDEAVSKRHSEVIAVFDSGDTRYGTSSAQRLIKALKVGNINPADCPENDQECKDNTALSILSADENLDINYVEPNTSDTPLHYAVKGNYGTVVERILRFTKIEANPKNSNGDTPLHIAVVYNYLEIVKELLRHRKLDINAVNNLGETVLHIATDLKYTEMVEELLRYRLNTLDVNLRDNNGEAAIHIAAEELDPTIMQALVGDRRVNVNLLTQPTPQTFGEAALHIAAEYGNTEIVRALLSDADIDVNIKNASGSTPLHIAAHHGSAEVVTVMLDFEGTDLTILDNQNLSAYGRAKQNNQQKIVDIFDNKRKNDDYVFRGTLLEELRDKEKKKNIENFAIEIIKDTSDNSDVNEKDQTTGNTPLHYAIEYNYELLLAELLKQTDIEVNLSNNRGETALHRAVQLGRQSMVTKLLAHATLTPNLKDGDSKAALFYTLDDELTAIATLLLEHSSIDPNTKNAAQDTVLLAAVKGQKTAIFDLLLAHDNINIDLTNSNGTTALLAAVARQHLAFVKALLAKNADVNTRNNNGESALLLATTNDYTAILDLLLAHDTIDVNIKNKHQETVLLIAVKEEKGVAVDKLLAHADTDVNLGNSKGKTPLMFAAERGSTAIVRQLLEYGLLKTTKIAVNAQDDHRFTALHYAAHNGHVEVVKLLLAHRGIDTTLLDSAKLTARERAATRGHQDVVRVFDQYNAGDIGHSISIINNLLRGDPENVIMTIINNNRANIAFNAKDPNRGNSALHLAAKRDYRLVVGALLSYKAIDVNASNWWNAKPLHIAAEVGHLQIVRMLLLASKIQPNARNRYQETPLHRAAARGHRSVVEVLLANAGVDASLKGNGGYTALHYAAQIGSHQVVQAFVNNTTMTVNLQTHRDRTALYYAAWFGHSRVVQELLKYVGISLDLVDTSGNTPLHMAARYNRIDIARMLLTGGADKGITNKAGKTARELAQEKNYTDMVALIDSN